MSFYFSPKNNALRKAQRLSLPGFTPDLTHRTNVKNCQSCKHMLTCEYPAKSFAFKCTKFESYADLKTENDYMAMLNFDALGEEREAEQKAISTIEEMMEQANSDIESGIQTDFVLEDRDIPLAKNFVDFYYNPQFAGVVKPMAKQIEICSELFTEICLNPKCSDTVYAADMPTGDTIDDIRAKVTFLEHGKCPNPGCGCTRIDMWEKYKARKSNTMALCSGQRSGKDWTVGLAFAYQDHRFLKLRDPAAALNLSSRSMLYQTFTGIDFSQARKATFLPYLDFVQESQWFKTYHQMLDDVAYKKGRKLYDIGKEAITWNYHGLGSVVQSPDVRGLRGVARRTYSVTEVSWFFTKTKSAIKLDVDGIIEALSNSTIGVSAGYEKTVTDGLYDIPSPLIMFASSPRSIKDYMMQLLKMADEDKTITARHYNTFQFNPNITEDTPSIKSLKIRNPEKYRTSILAIPPNSSSAFLSDKRLIMNCMSDKRPNAIKGLNKVIKSPVGAKMTSGDITIQSAKKVDTTSPKVLYIDAGLNNNSFALTVAHPVLYEDEETGAEVWYTIVDAMYEVIPYKNMEVSYPHVYDNIIVPLCEELNVVIAAIDRYPGAIQMIQQLDQDLEIPGVKRSIKYPDFQYFKQCLYNSTIDLPKMECDAKLAQDLSQNNYPHSFEKRPIAHTMIQAITVEDQMGKKIDKGEGFTDDLFYSLVGAHAICNDIAIREEYLLGGEGGDTVTEEVVGVSVGYSGTSSSMEMVGGANRGNEDFIGVRSSFRGG